MIDKDNATYKVGQKLVELCNAGKNLEAVDALYADDIVTIEPMGMPGMPARQQGIAAVRAKNKWWLDNHEVHSGSAEGPEVNGDRFVVRFKYDVTAKAGPMAGKRFTMQESAVYTVRDGKVAEESFFYNMG